MPPGKFVTIKTLQAMRKLFTFALCLSFMVPLMANDVQVANVSLTNRTATAMNISFNVSWKNSWRTSSNEANYDGVWMFAKYKKRNEYIWKHASLAQTGITVPGGGLLDVSADGKGWWLWRDADGFGDVNFAGAAVQWNASIDGVLATDSVEVRVFALEMVYIPQGSFFLGSGGNEPGHFFAGASISPADPYGKPFRVISEAAITIANTAGSLYYQHPGITTYDGFEMAVGDSTGTLAAAYPKGFRAFWVMKHEGSWQMMTDFYNTLTLQQAQALDSFFLNIENHPNIVSPIPYRVYRSCNILEYLAFLDWSALRPFTELEYEKICRGRNVTPYPNEYPWGNTTVQVTDSVLFINQITEVPYNGNLNARDSSELGDKGGRRNLRTGAYATSSSDRQTAGAAYYGVLEMAGNMGESVVTAGTPEGRRFTGLHGDGVLTTAGNANVANWPAADGGDGRRGGHRLRMITNTFNTTIDEFRTSSRTQAALSGALVLNCNKGVRGARTAE
jgi:formylglycine-generating enzyme required for sulfatase activity